MDFGHYYHLPTRRRQWQLSYIQTFRQGSLGDKSSHAGLLCDRDELFTRQAFVNKQNIKSSYERASHLRIRLPSCSRTKFSQVAGGRRQSAIVGVKLVKSVYCGHPTKLAGTCTMSVPYRFGRLKF